MRPLGMMGLVFLCLTVSPLAHAQTGHLTTAQAKEHLGEKATVCGNVVSTHFSESTHGSPTFLNLDEPYPKQVFTILIWGNDRSKFGVPETKYAHKQVCVTGLIKIYKGAPEVIASEPSQIEVQK
jgi:hypothetical protein